MQNITRYDRLQRILNALETSSVNLIRRTLIAGLTRNHSIRNLDCSLSPSDSIQHIRNVYTKRIPRIAAREESLFAREYETLYFTI